MTELVACPRCGDALDIPVELLGQPVRCAACRTVFSPTPTDAIPTAPRAMRPWTPPRTADAGDPAAKSNGWVWVVLLLLVGVFGGLVFLCTGLFRGVLNPEMTVHASDEGRFRVALPATPTNVSRTDDKIKVSGLLATRPEGQETFQVVSAELPAAEKRLDLSNEAVAVALLAELAKRHLPALAAGTEVQRDGTTHGPYPALDVLFEKGSGFVKQLTVARIVVAEGRVFVLSVQGGGLVQPHMWHVRRFFTSFEPLPPPPAK